MYPTLQLGGAALPLRPVLFLIACWVCLALTERSLPHHQLDGNLAWNFGMMAGGAGLIAARLSYALTHWAAYQANLAALIAPTPATLDLTTGSVIGAVAGLIYLQRRQVPLAQFADMLTPGLLVAFALMSLGAFLSGDAYGSPSNLPWAVLLWNERRHPSQIYELLVALATLALIWRLPQGSDGFLSLTATALYATGRVFIEAFRGDSLVVGDGLRTMQIIWLGIALFSIFLLFKQQFKSPARQIPQS